MQGSGWGVLAWEPLSERLVVEQVYVRPDYAQKLWSLVNWADVTRRFTEARGK